MSERRLVHRRHLIYYLRVFERESGQLLGHLVDVTGEGLLVMSPKPLEIGRVYPLRMYVSTETIPGGVLDFEARSMWGRPDVNPDFHDTGFQVIGANPAHLHHVETLIADFGFRD